MEGLYFTFVICLLFSYVYATARLDIVVKPSNNLRIGDHVTISCIFSGSNVLPREINWYYNDNEINASELLKAEQLNRISIHHMVGRQGLWQLTIRDAQVEDSGLWRCVGNLPVSAVNGFETTVVEGQYNLQVGAPLIDHASRSKVVSLGNTIVLKCNATGEPDPIIIWKRSPPENPLPSGQMNSTGEELSVIVRSITDAGDYVCQATNSLGSDSARITLNVNHEPTFFITMSENVVKGYIGETVNLTVFWSAFPLPVVTWYTENSAFIYPNMEVLPGKGVTILQVTPTAHDFIQYVCIAENVFGRSYHIVALIPARPPKPPYIVYVESTSADSLLLTIDSNFGPGEVPVSSYRVFYRRNGTTVFQQADFSYGQRVLVSNLTSSSTYEIFVAAGNKAGWGNSTDVFLVNTTANTSGATKNPHWDMTTTRTLPVPGTQEPRATKDVFSTANNSHSVETVSIAVLPWDPWHDKTEPSTDATSSDDTLFPTTPVLGNSGEWGASPAFIVIGLLLALMLSGCCIFILSTMPIYRWAKRRQSLKDGMEESLYQVPSSLSSDGSIQLRVGSYQSTSPWYEVFVEDIEFPRERLILGPVMGTGSFGKVVEAEALGIIHHGKTTVAVKTLKDEPREGDKNDLIKELHVMRLLRPHPNIVTLLGCCTKEDPLLIVMEHLPNGNLLSHLRNSRQKIQSSHTSRISLRSTLSQTDLIRYAYEVANGMAYLASMMCIHRDLAARNVLLSSDGVCKLADFGLARDVGSGGIYERKSHNRVPIRWMALESLLDNVYTSQSDVWSFGILLWEIVTIGAYPYPGINSKKLIRDLQHGYRMERPEHCSNIIYNLMSKCWNQDPQRRQNFNELRNHLENILIENRDYLVLDAFDECIYEYTGDDHIP